MNKKMDIWKRNCETNPAHTKKVNLGRSITAIDPYRQIEAATKEFGPAGEGWGWSVVDVQHLPTNEIGVLVRLWHGKPENSIDQWGQSSLYIDKNDSKKDRDCMKKAVTDGITKCLSCLGFNADVFLGKFDDNKYVQEMTQKHKSTNWEGDISKTETEKMLREYFNKFFETQTKDAAKEVNREYQKYIELMKANDPTYFTSIRGEETTTYKSQIEAHFDMIKQLEASE